MKDWPILPSNQLEKTKLDSPVCESGMWDKFFWHEGQYKRRIMNVLNESEIYLLVIIASNSNISRQPCVTPGDN